VLGGWWAVQYGCQDCTYTNCCAACVDFDEDELSVA